MIYRFTIFMVLGMSLYGQATDTPREKALNAALNLLRATDQIKELNISYLQQIQRLKDSEQMAKAEYESVVKPLRDACNQDHQKLDEETMKCTNPTEPKKP